MEGFDFFCIFFFVCLFIYSFFCMGTVCILFFLFYCFLFCDVIWAVGLYCEISGIFFHCFGSAIYLVDVVVSVSVRSTLVEY